MGDADIKIVAIAFVLAVTYGTFLFLNASADQVIHEDQDLNYSDYNTPNAGSFWTQIENVKDMSVDAPEIFFINTILFGTIGLLLSFVGLRFLRGTG